MKRTVTFRCTSLLTSFGLIVLLSTTFTVHAQYSTDKKIDIDINDYPYFSRIDDHSLNDNIKGFNSTAAADFGYYDDRFFLPGFDEIILASVEHNGEKYIGGLFTAFNGEILNGIAKWNGSGWEAIGNMFLEPSTRAFVYSLKSIDGDLYAAGAFILNEAETHYGVFKLDGSSWLPVGDSFDMNVLTLTEFEGDLYAGGFFTKYNGEFVDRVAKWNGSTWENAGSGLDHAVRDLIVWKDKLIAGGSFTGLTDQEIDETLFTGTYSFEQENDGLFGPVFNGAFQFESELTVDPQNPRYGRILTVDPYAHFGFGLELELRLNFSVNNNSVTFVEDIEVGLTCSEWLVFGPDSDPDESWFDPADDISFQFSFYENINLDCGAIEPNHHIFTVEKISAAKAVIDDITVLNRIALFDGEEWSEMGDGFNDRVNRLAIHEGDLLAAGNFTMSGENTVNRVAKWDGSTWQQMDAGFNDYVTDILSINSVLFASGSLTESGESPVGPIVLWNGSAWETAGDGSIPQSKVYRISEYSGNLFAGVGASSAETDIIETVVLQNNQWEHLGSFGENAMGVKARWVQAILKNEESLYIAGDIKRAGRTLVNNVTKWTPEDGWQALGSGLTSTYPASVVPVNDLIYYDDKLIAAGAFTETNSGSDSVLRVAYFDGSDWKQLGSGFNNGTVLSLIEYDGALYAGGTFSRNDVPIALRLAKWEGSGWEEVEGFGANGIVRSMIVHQGNLYLAGDNLLGNGEVIAFWDGQIWESRPLTGLPESVTRANDIIEHNGEIYISIVSAGNGNSNHYVARWNGVDEWQLLGESFAFIISELASHDGILYASGMNTVVDEAPRRGFVYWNGDTWHSLGLGFGGVENSYVHSFYSDSDGLYIGGNFTHVDGIPSYNLAKWITDSDGVPALPGKVSLLSPGNGETDVSINPHFEWLQSDGADSYTIQITKENSFNELAHSESGISGSSFELTESLESLTEYFWRVNGENQNGSGEWSVTWSFTTEMATSLSEDELPVVFTLSQNYPNPFNPTTIITFGLPEASNVQLSVYDMLGRRVAMIENGKRTAGWHNATFNASNLSSGMYIYRIQAGEFVDTRKMMLVK